SVTCTVAHAPAPFVKARKVPAALFSAVAYAWAGEPQPSPEEAGGRQGHLAVGLFFRHRYLLLLALLIAATQVMSTALDLRFSGLVEDAFSDKDARSAYLGGFYKLLNMAAALLQFVVAPAVLRVLPLRVVHTAIPLIHLCAGLALLLRPTLLVGAAAFMLFKALDYSLFRASKEILYIPLSFDVRYRAKEMIDAFVYRFSKGGLGLALTLAAGVVGRLPGSVYPLVAMGAALAWLPIVTYLLRHIPVEERAR
ncbi:MAG: Npt1/Npt2 family nucleotide transporter, partial [Armatimonadota bacterium]|nr:Npt1/Npt2 family nucleotide transporter [Armatimonadota bacterium]